MSISFGECSTRLKCDILTYQKRCKKLCRLHSKHSCRRCKSSDLFYFCQKFIIVVVSSCFISRSIFEFGLFVTPIRKISKVTKVLDQRNKVKWGIKVVNLFHGPLPKELLVKE